LAGYGVNKGRKAEIITIALLTVIDQKLLVVFVHIPELPFDFAYHVLNSDIDFDEIIAEGLLEGWENM
jgi:hypothetical protein